MVYSTVEQLALAETVGSAAVAVFKSRSPSNNRGIEISANHIRSVKNGYVTGIAKPVHLGKSTQLWQIKVFDDNQNLISICKLNNINFTEK